MMMNFRRQKNMPAALSSFGNWVQEPHIDEELSDEEDDKSSENRTPYRRNCLDLVNIDD